MPQLILNHIVDENPGGFDQQVKQDRQADIFKEVSDERSALDLPGNLRGFFDIFDASQSLRYLSSLLQIMKQHQSKMFFSLAVAAFLVIAWYATKTYNEFLFAIPVGIVIVSIALYNFKYFWYLTIFMVPLSITSHDLLGGAGVTFPTDFFALIIIGIMIFKMVSERSFLITHAQDPIVMLILLLAFWIMFTAIDSLRPLVSLKWLAQYIWTIGAFFFLPLLLFRRQSSIFRYIQLISIAFILALNMIFFLYLSTGRNPFGLRFNPGPFFLDHTVFGAFTAMWVPLLFVVAFRMDLTKREKLLAKAALFFFIAGLFFSYSRGAWASCVASLAFMGLLSVNRRVRRIAIPVLIFAMSIGGYLYYSNSSTSASAMKNDAVSRKDLSSHIASVTNFKTDYSNAERINRWYCAIKMWEDDPWTGLGPGTYAMEYGRYQKAHYITPVSTKRGDNGTAHNEFLLALSEMGAPGAILVFILFVVPVFRGIRGYNRTTHHNSKMLYLGVTFALVAYDIHALVNNFLDQDKVAATYFGFLAIIVALDRYAKVHQKDAAPELKS